jgi:hypothetical protein
MTDGPNPTARHLLTIDEAAAFLNVPARWVSEAVRQRRVRCTGLASTSGFAWNISRSL